MLRLYVFILIVAICYGARASPKTVDELDVPKYLGLWYQVYGDLASLNTITRNGECVTALYGNNDDKTISVRNFDRTASPDGSPNVITGFAYVTDASQPGKLSLKFDNIPYVGSYWVLSLGPEEDGKYQWSIVTDKNGVFLFVLARDVTTFKTKYDATVKLQLNELGFKGLSAPLPVYQGSDCQYEHSIRKKQIEDNFCTECELRCSNSIY